jgi:hypothetical protein
MSRDEAITTPTHGLNYALIFMRISQRAAGRRHCDSHGRSCDMSSLPNPLEKLLYWNNAVTVQKEMQD